jgi:predicted nucleic acid-binding protein
VTRPYVDTSALAKWFFNEPGTEAFETFARSQSGLAISTLTIVEFRSLVARRERSRSIKKDSAGRVVAEFDDLVRRSILLVHPLSDAEFADAARLIEQFGANESLTTLDALHLAAARAVGAKIFAVADRALASVGSLVGFEVVRFG